MKLLSIIIALQFFCSLSFGQDSNTGGISYGVFLLKNNDSDGAEAAFQKVVKSMVSLRKKRESYYQISINYNKELFFDLSIFYATEGLKINVAGDYLRKELNQVISNNHLDLKNYDLAEEYYKKSLIKGELPTANDNNLIGEIYRVKGEHKLSINYFHNAINIEKKASTNKSLSTYYNNIGLAHIELAHLDSASFYLKASYDLIMELDIKNQKSAINISFGKLYLAENNPEEAMRFYANTMQYNLSDHPDQFELYQDAYFGMSICAEQIGDYKNAFNAYKKYQEYQSKILNYSKQASVFQNQILIEREMHNKELVILNAKIVLEQKYKRALVIIICVVFLIVGLILYVLRLRNKSAKQKIILINSDNKIKELELAQIKSVNKILETEKSQRAQQERIKELERFKLAEKVDFQNRELSTNALHLLNKNDILAQIKEKVSDLSSVSVDEIERSVKQIKYLIKDNLHLDKDWLLFKKHFTDVHPDFFSALNNQFPALTADELKLCAYIKIQLSTKEIARLINITVVAINKRRNRMRKKLNLTPDVDLHDFLLNFKSEN